MKNITLDEFQQLIHNSTVLAEDGYGKKVIQLADNSIIKLFRVKRFLSSASIYSPARKFSKNAEKLHKLHIPTITACHLYNIKSLKRTAVHYQQLTGETLRDYMQNNTVSSEFLQQLGSFLATLHDKGIFFRSAHFGNIVYTPDHEFGLIDISDMKISKKPLNQNKRLRNLKHIFRLPEDIQLVKDNDIIEQSYLQSCGIRKKKFHEKFLTTCRDLKS